MAATNPKRARRIAIIALAVVAVLGVIAGAVPLVLSTDLVKRRIVDQITYLTGREFTFDGDPSLSLYPYLTVRLHHAVLADADGMGSKPFIEMDRMTGKLEILPLLLGRLEFAQFKLVNPRIDLRTDADGHGNWILTQGAVGSQVSKGDKQGSTSELAPPSPLADIKLGRFAIRDGVVNYTDDRSGRREELSKVNVSFDWTSSTTAARGTGSFVWRGEPVKFNSGIDAPLALLTGGSSPVRFAFTAAPLRLSFTGTALQLGGAQLEGDIELTTPSVRRVVEWMGAPIETGAILGAGSIAGRINWLGSSVSLSDATIELDGNIAEGAVSATINDGLTSLQGTIAFDSLDLSPYLEAARARITDSGPWMSAPLQLPLDEIGDLDLRVSTSQLKAGSLTVGRTAATAILKKGRLVVTVGEAQLGDGTAEARLLLDTDKGDTTGAGQLKLHDVAVSDVLGDLPGLIAIDGTVNGNINMRGRGTNWGDFVDSLTGKARLTITDGAFKGIDFASLPAALQHPEGYAIEGSTAFATSGCTLALADGVVTTDDFHAEGSDFTLTLGGHAGLVQPSIQARGVLSLRDGNGASQDVPFLVDGTWTNWHLSPDLGPPVARGATPAEPIQPPPDHPPNG
jgi:AsmA protein